MALDILRGCSSLTVVVVSPLAAFEGSSPREKRDSCRQYVSDSDPKTEREICEGRFQLIYFSLELLLIHPVWGDRLLVTFVIDEAHCVKRTHCVT